MSIQKYVLGFLFDDSGSQVVLIRKTKPKWQAGLLNGIGGKIEEGETPAEAMVREFNEETGVLFSAESWREYAVMSGDGFAVYCFTCQDTGAFEAAETQEVEDIEKREWKRLPPTDCISNLLWLIPMALDENYGHPPYATIRYSEPYKDLLPSQ